MHAVKQECRAICPSCQGYPGASRERDDGRPEAGGKESDERDKITPVLFAAEIEPCVTFWVERFGFKKTVEVPESNQLGFAIVQDGDVELMYQSYASADKDAPAATAQAVRKGPAFLYVEVENLDETMGTLRGVEVVMPVRTTFYGAREIGVKDPAGHFVTFAQTSATPQK